MDIEQYVEEIAEAVYNPPDYHDDKFVQRRCVMSTIYEILENLAKEAQSEVDVTSIVVSLERKIEDLEEEVATLESALEKAREGEAVAA